MTISTLPLSYCTNVHPGQTVAEVVAGLEANTLAIRERFGWPLAAGLWLAAPVIDELGSQQGALELLAGFLERHAIPVYTLNAFPYGNFHSDRVKEQVYLPDWAHADRLRYTLGCARTLARLMSVDGTGKMPDGSISTVPLAFAHRELPANFVPSAIGQLLECAEGLHRVFEETGRRIRLAIEPEPCCLLETTAQTVAFFERLFAVAKPKSLEPIAREYLGVCYDVCHQAVEFESPGECVASLHSAGIRLNKLHITCAVELRDPANNLAGRTQLAAFAEPRYLHQVYAANRVAGGGWQKLAPRLDLSADFAINPPPEFLAADAWRIHFHVPVNATKLGTLATTRSDLEAAVPAVAKLPYSPHLEVETYTWSVMPGERAVSIPEGFAKELISTHELLGRSSGDGLNHSAS